MHLVLKAHFLSSNHFVEEYLKKTKKDQIWNATCSYKSIPSDLIITFIKTNITFQ